MSDAMWMVVDLGHGERYLGKDVSDDDDKEEGVLRLREVVGMGQNVLSGATKEKGPFVLPMLYYTRLTPLYEEFAPDFVLEINEDFVRWVAVVAEEVVTKLRSDMLAERSKMKP